MPIYDFLFNIFIKKIFLISKKDEKKRLKKLFDTYHSILNLRNITYVNVAKEALPMFSIP